MNAAPFPHFWSSTIESLDDVVSSALAASSADGQGGDTNTGVKWWKQFCELLGIEALRTFSPNTDYNILLQEEWIVLQFIAFLVTKKKPVAPSTAQQYVSQVQGWLRTRAGAQGLAGGLKLTRVARMCKGLWAQQGGRPPRKARHGFTPARLRRQMDRHLDPSIPEHANMRAALAAGFQGLLRANEYLQQSGKRAKSVEGLPQRKDMRRRPNGFVLYMTMSKKKEKSATKSTPLLFGRGGKFIDVCAELDNLARVDPAGGDEPLFRRADGRPITHDDVNKILKKFAQDEGLNPAEFASHSLRIGGATAIFAAGGSPLVIRTMGRWSSDIYEIYVRANDATVEKWSRLAGSADFENNATLELTDEFLEISEEFEFEEEPEI